MTHPVAAAPDFAWTPEEIRRVGYRVVDMIAGHLSELPGEPVFRPVPERLAEAMLAAPVPAGGESADALLDRVAAEVLPYPFGNGHPRFAAWVNSPPAVMGVFGAALAAAMNPSVAGGNHAAVWVERQVVGWFRTLFGFGAASTGQLVSGGSAAALTALAAARHRACARRGWDVRAAGVQDRPPGVGRLLVYKSAEGHGCNQKAAELLGIGSANLRAVPVDAALRIDPGALDALLAADVAAGAVPVAVVASAGTVNTGAIDPLDAIADVCARHGVWLHVDGAYGAPAVLLPECAAALGGLARADSVAVDPHKWLYVPVDAGLVLVQDAATLRDAFSLVPPYLRTDDNVRGVQGPPWFSEYGAEQTRPFRALKVWMALRSFGVEGYRALVRQDVARAAQLAALVRATPGLELWEPPSLSIVCFRVAPPALAGDDAALDRLNQRLLSAVQLGGEAFLSSTVLAGRFWLRACFVNPRTTAADVQAIVQAVTHAAAPLLAGGPAAAPPG